jgi:hypothetical protein
MVDLYFSLCYGAEKEKGARIKGQGLRGKGRGEKVCLIK